MPWRRVGRRFVGSFDCRDVSKPCSHQNGRRIAARVSAKVGPEIIEHFGPAIAETKEGADEEAVSDPPPVLAEIACGAAHSGGCMIHRTQRT